NLPVDFGNLPKSSEGSEQVAPNVGQVARATQAAMLKGAERARMLRAARPLLETMSLTDVATLIGTSAPTLCRLRKDYAHLTDDEITPENLSPVTSQCGRASAWDAFAQNPEVRRRLQQL